MRRIVSLAFLAIASAHAQSFDVASVKPSQPAGDRIDINLGTYRHGEVTLTNTTLSECIQFAYDLVSEDQIDGPDWIRDRSLRVDIIAKTSPDTPRDQALLMTQALLNERFHMRIHREPKPVRHLELTVGKKGPKMAVWDENQTDPPSQYYRGRLFYNHRSMHSFALLLSRQLKQPVIDLTGLSGFYNVRLEWASEDPMVAAPPASDAGAPLPDIYQAVEEQMGLHLEAKKTPIEVIVVDRADKVPVPN
ncbi:MAG TPA: TIGR03435 family protein [Bryobacteraceae bacterium]|nr:TIGR03435 family protein [Bryobacteraceae bacterium]